MTVFVKKSVIAETFLPSDKAYLFTSFCPYFLFSPGSFCEKVTVQKKIPTNAAADMAAVSVPTWALCVNVTQALG